MDTTKTLIRAGGRMSNILYNLAQDSTCAESICEQMKAAQEEWDAALAAHSRFAEPAEHFVNGTESLGSVVGDDGLEPPTSSV